VDYDGLLSKKGKLKELKSKVKLKEFKKSIKFN
jgi:hypothetical protein